LRVPTAPGRAASPARRSSGQVLRISTLTTPRARSFPPIPASPKGKRIALHGSKESGSWSGRSPNDATLHSRRRLEEVPSLPSSNERSWRESRCESGTWV
jgi:hypothetical protein